MSVAASAWCVVCGEAPEATIVVERNGMLAHYGTCSAHLQTVAGRVQAEATRRRPTRPQAPDAIDTDAREPNGEDSRLDTVCYCPPPVHHDSVGECDRCHRLVLTAPRPVDRGPA